MWLLFAALGFVGGQVLAAVFVAITAAVEGKLSSLTTIARLDEPPTWYIVSTLLGLWAGFFGAGWMATGVRGTKSFVRDLGLRFRWADLIGIPFRLAIGKKGVAEGIVELKRRNGSEVRKLKIDEAVKIVVAEIQAERK